VNADIKDQWLYALEFGGYDKGKMFLRDMENQYCCIGVLCEIVDTDPWTHFPEDPAYRFKLNASFMDEVTLSKAGLTLADQSNLANINDKTETFADVIDYIEKML
jgi:hypothetical protein